jgi:ABC-type arginine/histidine transport system permease subunit
MTSPTLEELRAKRERLWNAYLDAYDAAYDAVTADDAAYKAYVVAAAAAYDAAAAVDAAAAADVIRRASK